MAAWGGASGLMLPGFSGCGRNPPAEPAGGGRAPKLLFGLIGREADSPVFQAAAYAAQQKAAELSRALEIPIEVRVQAPPRGTPAAQAEWVDQLVRDEAAGIAIDVADPNILRQSVADATALGVPVLCFHTDLPDSNRFISLGVDEVVVGETLMRRCISLLQERHPDAPALRIAILGGHRRSSQYQKRIDAAQTEAMRHEQVRLAGTFSHQGTPGDPLRTLIEAERDDGPIDGWVLLGDWPLGAEESFPWDVAETVCVSATGFPTQLPYLRRGDVQTVVIPAYPQFGVRALELLVERARQGTHPTAEYEWLPCDEFATARADELEQNWQKWLTPPANPAP